MDAAAFQRLLDILRPDPAPRVWSLIVTLFGDMAQSPDARLSGAFVNAVMGGVGIKAQAVRVALHRLKKDGWIDSEKSGRTSGYFLTERGLAESRAANPVIYGPRDMPQSASLLVREPGASAEVTMGFPITPHTTICTAPPDPDFGLVVPMTEGRVPDWVSARLCPPDLTAASKSLFARLERLDRAALTTVTPLQSAILRVLIVHEWRRISLKAPKVPPFLLPSDWQGAACAARVDALLDGLDKPDTDMALQDASA